MADQVYDGRYFDPCTRAAQAAISLLAAMTVLTAAAPATLVAGLLAAHRLDHVSVLEIRGGRGRLALQLDSSWARVMRHLLTGR